MASNTTRNTTSRSTKSREVVYTPPENIKLDVGLQEYFNGQGYKLRWIRYMLDGKDDVKNWLKREKEGWVPVKNDELPAEYQGVFDIGGAGKTEGVVTNNDVILAKIPVEMARARQDYYEGLAQDQIDAVNAQLLSGNRKMPGFNESHTKTTRGRPPANFGASRSEE